MRDRSIIRHSLYIIEALCHALEMAKTAPILKHRQNSILKSILWFTGRFFFSPTPPPLPPRHMHLSARQQALFLNAWLKKPKTHLHWQLWKVETFMSSNSLPEGWVRVIIKKWSNHDELCVLMKAVLLLTPAFKWRIQRAYFWRLAIKPVAELSTLRCPVLKEGNFSIIWCHCLFAYIHSLKRHK